MSAPDRPRAWALGLLLPAFALGLFAGVYMTRHHDVSKYGSEDLQGELIGCVESAKVSCDIVNTSEWSTLLGVPQFTWAIPMYALLLALALYSLVRRDRSALWLIVGLGLFNSAYSVFLGYISYVELGKLCTWCMRLYAINVATPILGALAGVKGAPLPGGKVLGLAAAMYGVTAVGSIAGERAYRASLLGDEVETEALPTAEEVEEEGPTADPEGPPPTLSWEVETEDGNPATLSIEPDDAWKGAADAEVAVVEFADLECGYCKRASGELKRLYEAYGDRVAFVFKHYPMDPACNEGVRNRKHRYACLAAEAAVCAQRQGRFWAFHDITFKNQHNLRPDDLRRYADSAGMDVDAFEQCMRSREGRDTVQQDGAHGKELDTHGTPRIWIDGKLYRAGTSAEQMARALELALGANAREAAAAARELRQVKAPIEPVPADVPEMQSISHGGLSFEIDTFEAGLADGVATSGKHQVPGLRMSWFAARDACEAAGKRLCTEEEWITACQGARAVDDDDDGAFADDDIEGTSYPYGEHHLRGHCWDNQGKLRPVYTGEMPGCVSTDGVYDLTGNAEEWVGTSPETAVLLGGAFDTSKDFARCYRRNDTFGPGLANQRTGFRCCR